MRKALWATVLAKVQAEAYWMPVFAYATSDAWAKSQEFKQTSDEIPQFFAARWR